MPQQLLGATYGQQTPVVKIEYSPEMPEECPDPQFFFTQEEFMQLPRDINLDELLPMAKRKPKFKADTDIGKVRFLNNEREAMVWEDGLETKHLWFPTGTLWETMCIEINGELATVETIKLSKQYYENGELIRYYRSYPLLNRLDGVDLDLEGMTLKNNRQRKFLGLF